MTKITSRQIAKFEQDLSEAYKNSVQVSDTLLAKLAARRDAYLANLR
tara:strand:+ start:1399 stop:1539 length:141 start_codon:yes stop_codon:yes gene_type:complete